MQRSKHFNIKNHQKVESNNIGVASLSQLVSWYLTSSNAFLLSVAWVLNMKRVSVHQTIGVDQTHFPLQTQNCMCTPVICWINDPCIQLRLQKWTQVPVSRVRYLHLFGCLSWEGSSSNESELLFFTKICPWRYGKGNASWHLFLHKARNFHIRAFSIFP